MEEAKRRLRRRRESKAPAVDDEAKGAGPTYTASLAMMALAVNRHVLPADHRKGVNPKGIELPIPD